MIAPFVFDVDQIHAAIARRADAELAELRALLRRVGLTSALVDRLGREGRSDPRDIPG